MAKKDKINTAFSMITGGEKNKGKAEHVNPVGVALDPGELARLDEIAKELNQTRHKVLQYAVKDFIRRYNQGEKPKTRTETKTILNPD